LVAAGRGTPYPHLVKLTRRGAEEPEQIIEPEPAEFEVAAGKGRPTPKRRDVAPKRQPMSAPRTRKEASAYSRTSGRRTTSSGSARRDNPRAKMTTQEFRAAQKRGDPAVLTRRDQGPVRKLARDWVDSRRMLSNFVMVLFIPILGGAFVHSKQASYVVDAIVLAFLLFLLVEWFITGRKVIALAVSRGIESREKPMSLGLYCGSRAFLPRRFRLPNPTYQLGDEV
jgi:hypothetical protein